MYRRLLAITMLATVVANDSMHAYAAGKKTDAVTTPSSSPRQQQTANGDVWGLRSEHLVMQKTNCVYD